MEENYEYEGFPLTNPILVDIIPKLFNKGKAMAAMDILAEASKYHLDNGGKPFEGKSEKSDLIKFISGVLNALRKKNIAYSPPGARGWWKIGKDISVAKEREISNEKIENTEPLATPTMADEIIIEAKFGEGSGSVYAYYFPRDKGTAIQNKVDFFPHKIGQTAKDDAVERVLEQTSASSPETPIIALIIKTDYPKKLEKLIHDILNMRGRKVPNIKGNEWFKTCTLELDSIHSFVMLDILDS